MFLLQVDRVLCRYFTEATTFSRETGLVTDIIIGVGFNFALMIFRRIAS